jgi:hypothetical protein
MNEFRMVALVSLLVIGCGAGGAESSWDGEVRDSAGLRIVENGERGLWSEDDLWTLRPGLSIGGGPGEDDDLVAVADVDLDSRGRVLALDIVARQVRIFDADGEFAGTIGRSGEGPGEFSRFLTSLMVVSGDTVIVPDWAQARVSLFAPGGGFARQMSALPRVETQGWKRMADGGFLLRGVTIGRDAENLYTTYDALYRTNADLTVIDTLIEFDYPRSNLGGNGPPIAPLIVNAAFWTRLDDGRIAWSSLDRAHVMIHDASGSPIGILRHAAWTREPLTETHRSILKERFREKFRLMGASPDVVDNIDLRYEETLPALAALQAGPDETLWVQRMGDVAAIDPMVINTNDRTDGMGGRSWDVFDAGLRYLGSVELPARFRILRFRGDTIWGVRKDEFDVELVEWLELIRGN